MFSYGTGIIYNLYFLTPGNLDIVRETQIDSQATVYADDFGFLEPVCSETCDPEADGSESHSFVSSCPT